MYDERDYYTPKYFTKTVTYNEKTGKKEYKYAIDGDKYWRLRDAGDWSGAP